MPSPPPGKRVAANAAQKRRLRIMAASGLVTRREAAEAIQRPYYSVALWGRKMGLTFANGHTPLVKRLMMRRDGAAASLPGPPAPRAR